MWNCPSLLWKVIKRLKCQLPNRTSGAKSTLTWQEFWSPWRIGECQFQLLIHKILLYSSWTFVNQRSDLSGLLWFLGSGSGFPIIVPLGITVISTHISKCRGICHGVTRVNAEACVIKLSGSPTHLYSHTVINYLCVVKPSLCHLQMKCHVVILGSRCSESEPEQLQRWI